MAEQLKALNLPKDREMGIWVYDELRYGLHPLLRKVWSLIGERVIAPVNRRFKKGQCFRSDPGKIHVIVGDGAGFHHKED